MPKPYRVCLTPADRTRLTTLATAGTAPARTLTHARIQLKADQGEAGPAGCPRATDARIAEALETSVATVERVRRRGVSGGLDARARPPPAPAGVPAQAGRGRGSPPARPRLLAPPAGQQRWSCGC